MDARWNDGRRFEGRVAVVTGAGGAIGGAVARAFGREGAAVALSYRSRREAAEDTAGEIETGGGRAYAGKMELTDRESVTGFVSDVVDRFGHIDVLVNTAGRIDDADTVRFSALDDSAAQAILDVDVMGTLRMCQAAVPHMRHGAIVNFSSTYGNGADPDNPVNGVPVAYCTAKGAIRGFTASLARDLAPDIRVNALAPGPIAGNWEDDWDVPKEKVDAALEQTPLKRMGLPDEIAETVLFLASDGGGYVTGQTIHVDGGWNLTG
jgi:NAD(P)-dependent dehydrogenase (short-subunit alcohol dehydrogenase family)